MAIREEFAHWLPEISTWRQHIHQYPELQFDTVKTAEFVANKLREFGCDRVHTGMARNGIVGVINGRNSASERTIGLRADMDALPIEEVSDLPYKSRISGKMHACGHDGHTAILLGVSKYLCETRHFEGQVVVIFQPAEEGGGGARVMCEEGLMDSYGIDEVYGLHNMPGQEVGTFSIRPGAFFAATDEFNVKLIGTGGHGAMPNKAIDPVIASAHLITALQTIVSRNADPVDQVVLSVTSIVSSSQASNVIPKSVALRGTIRTMSERMRDLVEKRFKEIVEFHSQSFRVEAEIQFRRGYPAMVNHAENTEFAREGAKKVAGVCDAADMIMGAEDFAYMLEERPGAYILVGNGESSALHTPSYNFNDDAIPFACSWMVEMVETRLALSNTNSSMSVS